MMVGMEEEGRNDLFVFAKKFIVYSFCCCHASLLLSVYYLNTVKVQA